MSNTTIAIIGGGCSGTMIAAQQMLKLIEQKTIADWASAPDHKINFKLYDKDGSIGRGEPYALDNEGVFLLNQPAYAMSPFPEYPEHFSTWLKNKQHHYNQDDFVPRSIYGEYLQDVFQKAAQTYTKLDFGRVEVVVSNVANICPTDNGKYIVVSDDYNADHANVIVLASGHSRSDLLSEYSHNPHYFSAPYDKEKAKRALQGNADPVMILGTSQSMLDSLALLDHIKFPNPIYAVSRRLVKPWLFDAKAHRENKGSYQYQFLTKQAVTQEVELNFEDLKELFDKDLQEGQSQGFPMGHIVSRFNPHDLLEVIENRYTRDNFSKFIGHVGALYGNPTSPERFKLMQEYEKSGQLRFLQADMLEADIAEVTNGFVVTLQGQDPLKIAGLFNSSSYSMKAISDNNYVSSPLLRKLDERKALKRHDRDKNAFAFGEQNWNNLFLAGPSCNSQRWGVETFRDGLSQIAERSVQKIKQGMIAAPS